MKPSMLKKDLMLDMFTTAANVHMRYHKATSFVLACDSGNEDADGNATALAHVFIVSATDANELEDFFRKREHVMLEMLRKDFEQ